MSRTPARRPIPDTWAHVLAAYDRAQRHAGVAEVTIAVRGTHLRQSARALPAGPRATTAADLAAYIDARTWAPATRRNYVKTLRGFFRWAARAGHTDTDPAAGLSLRLDPAAADVLRERARQRPERAATGPEPASVPAPWADWFTEYRRYQLAGGTPMTTLRTRSAHLRQLARALDPIPPADVDTGDLLDYMAAQSWAAETRRNVRQTLRGFFRWAAETGLSDDDPAAPLPRVKAGHALPRPITEDAYRFALTIADKRVRLMLRLAAELGLRRAEVAQVHTRDVIETDTGRSLVVHGKGGKDRTLPLPAGIAAGLAGSGPGYLFPGEDHGHLSPQYVGKLVGAALPAGATMHQLRHRFATLAYQATRDLLTTQQVLGHASPATTQRYVAVADTQARALMAAVAAGTATPSKEPAV